ncbi:MAG TPA: hypothetical protein VEV62_05610 [Parafilimonas sp.]|nr:hypothetical protein [Parafilimonas sp.]
MLPYIENILQTLTRKSSLSEVSEEELKQIADKYPYFGATQFLLGKKLYQQETKDAEIAIQKAALHFTDALWLHYNFLEEEKVTEENPTVQNAEQLENNSLNVNAADEEVTTINKTSSVLEILAEAEVILNEEENILKDYATESDLIEEDDDNSIEDKNNIIEEKNNFKEIKETDFENLPETDNTELLDEPETEPNEKLSNLLKEQAAAFEKPAEETVLPVETTAYHRIDYFDSQGIKLEEEKANDKLGIQLKRFTDWLKQMKKINPNLNALETDAAAESQVQNMAEHSNEPKEVVTEAMAEVLVKQGKPEQAIQIYEKLSFFNPSKSAYFAAKIQELKP